jgi:hypothetical protein
LRESFAELVSETWNYKPLQNKLECTEMTNCQFQTIFKEKSHLEFWCEFGKGHLSLSEVLVLFFSDSAMLPSSWLSSGHLLMHRVPILMHTPHHLSDLPRNITSAAYQVNTQIL